MYILQKKKKRKNYTIFLNFFFQSRPCWHSRVQNMSSKIKTERTKARASAALTCAVVSLEQQKRR